MDANTEAVLMGKAPDATTPSSNANQSISSGEPASSTSGNAAQVAPVDGQPAGQKSGETAGQQQPSKDQVAADAKKAQDDLKSALGFAESPEKKQERLEREYAASSKESRRLSEANKKLVAMLKEQGLDLAEDEGVPIGFVANPKYSKNIPDLDVQFKNLTESEQELFMENPDKAIKLVLDRAKQAFVRATPTLERAPAQCSPEREQDAVKSLETEKWMDGSPKHSDLSENMPLIKDMLASMSANKAVKEFMAQEPKMIREYLNLRVRAAKQFLADQAQKAIAAKQAKESKAAGIPDFAPAGGGGPTLGVASNDIGAAIAKAGYGY